MGQQLIVFSVLAGAAVLFASNRLRSDLVALLIVLALVTSGVLTVGEGLAGFADPVVILLAALFIVSEALVNTGVTQRVSQLLLKAGGTSETRLTLLLMLAIAAIGAFMSSTAAVAMFIPVALTVAGRARIDPRRLMMPLSIAGLISGMMTLIATAPNLVVADALAARGLDPFSFFAFTPFGVIILIVAAGFMLLVGRRMLSRGGAGPTVGGQPSLRELARAFGLGEPIYLRVAPGSPWHDQTLSRLRLGERFGLLAPFVIPRGEWAAIELANPDTVLMAKDIVILAGNAESLPELARAAKLAPVAVSEETRAVALQHVGAAEIMLTPQSRLIGESLREFGAWLPKSLGVVAVRHRGRAFAATDPDARLDFGDALLVAGPWQDILDLRQDAQNVVVLTVPNEFKDVRPAAKAAPWAFGILVAMVVAMATGLQPTVVCALIAALAMLATGCVPLDRVYQVVHWPTVVLVAGILPLATALQKTGTNMLIAQQLVALVGGLGPLAMLATVFLVTAGIGAFVSNTATAVLIAPIAIDVALDIGVSPYAFAMTVAIACSAAYTTPVSSPVNTLVVEPGGYAFLDFVKVGVPLLLLTMVVSVVLARLLYL